jgi:DNA-binding NarL/FixJ family response regulator
MGLPSEIFHPRSKGPPTRRGRRPPCVLVVEDDSTVRGAFERALSQAGYQVLTVASLGEGQSLLAHAEHRPDAAVLDQLLPDGNGLEMVEPLLRRVPMCRSVIITGAANERMAVEAAKVGAHGYVRKPCSRSQLISAVARTVQATREWRDALGQVGDALTQEVDRDHPSSASAPVDLDLHRMVARLQYLGNLSPVETITAWRLLWGDSNEQIASMMGCTRRTVKFHVSEILARTGGRSRADLLRVLLEDAGVEDPWARASKAAEATEGSTEDAPGEDQGRRRRA